MKSVEKFVLGSLLVASVSGINYNISFADQIQQTYITTNRLNMRKGPSIDYMVVGTLDKGEKVVPLEKSDDGKWVKINYKSQIVWINMSYLQKETAGNNNSGSSTIKLGSEYQTTSNLNMRKGASTDYIKIETIPVGTKVIPTNISNDGKWVQVKYNNQTGWIITDYIKIIGTTTPTTPSKPNIDIQTKNLSGTYQATANVSFRKGAGTSYDRYCVVPCGTKVEVSAITTDGEWIKATYNKQTGWIKSDYLTKISSGNTEGTGSTTKPTSDVFYTTANINFRVGASTTSSKIGQIPIDTKVTVVDYNSDKSWVKVTYSGKTGWVSTQYLTDKAPIKPAIKEETYWMGTTSENLNLRKGPSTSYAVIVGIPKNTKIKVYEESNGWAKVKYQAYEGYCSALYIK